MEREPFLADSIRELKKLQGLAEAALAQLSEEEFFAVPGMGAAESNSCAVILQHLSGNMLSRWTDFLTTDGEKPWRNRDREFEVAAGSTREQAMERSAEGWRVLFSALEPLTAEDLDRTVLIRGEPHTVRQAIIRQLAHYGYHVGQIVFLAKHLAASRWRPLSIPRGESQRFNQEMGL